MLETSKQYKKFMLARGYRPNAEAMAHVRKYPYCAQEEMCEILEEEEKKGRKLKLFAPTR